MDVITINCIERDQLRAWFDSAEGGLGDLAMSVLSGRVDGLRELRAEVDWQLASLDEIGWERAGAAGHYTVMATPKLRAYVSTELEIAEEEGTAAEQEIARSILSALSLAVLDDRASEAVMA